MIQSKLHQIEFMDASSGLGLVGVTGGAVEELVLSCKVLVPLIVLAPLTC